MRSSILSGIVVAAIVVPVGAAGPTPVEVRVAVEVDPRYPRPASILVRAEALDTVDDASSMAEAAVAQGEAGVALSMTPGRAWQVTAEAEGFWSTDALVWPSARDPIRLEMRPVGWLEGRLAFDAPLAFEDLGAMKARFEPPGDEDMAGRTALAGETTCRLRDDPADERRASFTCPLPAGPWDLRLRLEGHVSHYRWDQDVDPGAKANLGTLPMRRGASIVGRITTADGKTLHPESCSIITRPTISRSSTPAGDARRGRHQTLRARPTRSGFFHLEGLAPGAYDLVVEHPGYVTREVGGIVLGGPVEATLDEPIVLERPRSLTVDVVPTRGPGGEPWTLAVQSPAKGEMVTLQATERPGTFTATGFSAGAVLVVGQDHRGRTVAMAEVALDGPENHLPLEIPGVDVAGAVVLGAEPLASSLTFRDPGGLVSLSFDTDDEGLFSGWLPRDGAWAVDVRAVRANVHRRLEAVAVDREADGSATVVIELPDSEIRGRVVDERGQAVPGARVLVLPVDEAERPAEAATDSDGSFAFAGVTLGTVHIEAEGDVAGRRASSGAQRVELDEAAAHQEVELILWDREHVAGVIYGMDGRPVSDADIRVVRQQSSRPTGIVRPQARSDHDGRFSLALASGVTALSLTVLAPGHALHVGMYAVDRGEPVRIDLTTIAGDVAVDLGGPRTLGVRDVHPRLTFEGVFDLSWITLAQWARAHGAEVGWTGLEGLALPMMPPGRYRLCLDRAASTETCDEADLNPGQTIELSLARSDAIARSRDVHAVKPDLATERR